MPLFVIPRITPEDLEKILKHLPEPTYAEVDLFGKFDYSTILVQAEEIMPGIGLKDGGRQTFRLKDLSKEKILDFYRRSYKTEEEDAKVHLNPRKIDLNKINWYLDDDVRIELTPWEVNVKYNGQEPEYISQMRKELSETRVRLGIEINK